MDSNSPVPESTERNRLLASVAIIGGTGLLLGAPFALRAGSEFFLPLTVALILSIALVPLLEWLERRRVPSALAAFICVIAFLVVANGALALIIVPATTWFVNLPGRIPKITSNLQPLIDLYADAQRYLDETLTMMRTEAVAEVQKVTTESPTSLIDVFISAAPAVGIQMVFAILVIFFFLSGWTRIRTGAINSRGSFTAAMATARVIQNVVSATSAYLTTITLINILLGISVGFVLYLIGMESPAMWGGIVALLNFIPYLGPVLAAVMLALGGLMTFDDLTWALLPAIIQITFHTVEANLVTPMILGRRLTMNPLLILISLSFWSWIWGTLGALLAVPLLIIIQTIIAAAGKPDIAGFLFESGTLTRGQGAENKPPPPPAAPAKQENAPDAGKVTQGS
ncbi:MAG: AI-2E family transporter [Pseudomonadota bacterium]